MKVAALITEYNPFHNGHLYHVRRTREVTGADYIIVIMSGDFVQRGEPAIIDKYSRCRMALNNQVDLVIELPVCFSTASAEFFAMGAISIINKLGIVDFVCFGSESGDISLLNKVADIFYDEPAEYRTYLNNYLKQGNSFALSREKALKIYLENVDKLDNDIVNNICNLIKEPNNILAIEYIKAIKALNSNVEAITINRIDNGYNDIRFDDKSRYASATAIRQNINHNYCQYVPKNVSNDLQEKKNKTYPIFMDDFSIIMHYKLSNEDVDSLKEYLDIDSNLANKIVNYYSKQGIYSYLKLITACKSKDVAYTRIARGLLHVLLNIKKTDMEHYVNNGLVEYARILGFNLEASRLIRLINDKNSIITINKVADAKSLLSDVGYKMLSFDIFASHLYNRIAYEKYGYRMKDEYRQGVIIGGKEDVF